MYLTSNPSFTVNQLRQVQSNFEPLNLFLWHLLRILELLWKRPLERFPTVVVFFSFHISLYFFKVSNLENLEIDKSNSTQSACFVASSLSLYVCVSVCVCVRVCVCVWASRSLCVSVCVRKRINSWLNNRPLVNWWRGPVLIATFANSFSYCSTTWQKKKKKKKNDWY